MADHGENPAAVIEEDFDPNFDLCLESNFLDNDQFDWECNIDEEELIKCLESIESEQAQVQEAPLPTLEPLPAPPVTIESRRRHAVLNEEDLVTLETEKD